MSVDANNNPFLFEQNGKDGERVYDCDYESGFGCG